MVWIATMLILGQHKGIIAHHPKKHHDKITQRTRLYPVADAPWEHEDHLIRLLDGHHIHSMDLYADRDAFEVFVPLKDRKRTLRLIRNDAKRHGYLRFVLQHPPSKGSMYEPPDNP